MTWNFTVIQINSQKTVRHLQLQANEERNNFHECQTSQRTLNM